MVKSNKRAILDFLKTAIFKVKEKEMQVGSSDKLLSFFEEIKDNYPNLDEKYKAEEILKRIENFLALHKASHSLLHYYYMEFQNFLDYSEKYRLFGEMNIKSINYVAQCTETGSIQYTFKK